MITNELYDQKSVSCRFVPVFLDRANSGSVPEPLRSATHYLLTTEDAYKELTDYLAGAAGIQPARLGPPPDRTRRTGAALRFDGSAQIMVSRLPSVSPVVIGRDDEFTRLDDAWNSERVRLVTLIGLGGVGKTSLAINWWHRRGAPGATRVLGWSFHAQGAVDGRQTSADVFLDHALHEWFRVTARPTDSWSRGERLRGTGRPRKDSARPGRS